MAQSSAKERIDVAVVMPVGPRENLEFLQDTIDSIRFYTDGAVRFVLVDDSQGHLDLAQFRAQPDIDMLTAAPRRKTINMFGIMFINIANGINRAIELYDFDVLLRIDVDALVVGKNPIQDILKIASENPKFGIFGSFKINGNGAVCNWVTDRTLTGSALRPRFSPKYPKEVAKRFLTPFAYFVLNRHMKVAEKHGYTCGDFVAGGIVFWTSKAIQDVMVHVTPFLRHCQRLRIPEDYIFTMFAYRCGYEAREFGRPGDPTIFNLKGMPVSPEEVVRQNKSVVHSTRGYQDMTEQDVRNFFKQIRDSQSKAV